ncbi:MAG: dihydrofolate reductase family protein [Anaerolineae bacterium]|nr:dihydrofolate reductase family protein [Anaerolineae bacterium]
MRKIVAGEFVSADGVMEAANAWQFPYQTEEMGEITERQIREASAFLMGRVTYEMFAGYWPTLKNNEFGVADKMNSAPKYVVSTTLQKADWNNSTHIKSIEELRKLKQQTGGTIAVIGSMKLVHSLLEARLLDEVQALVHPLVLGKGGRLFPDGYHASMKVVDSKILSNGVVYLSYQIEHEA